jgi:hypothetical protein
LDALTGAGARACRRVPWAKPVHPHCRSLRRRGVTPAVVEAVTFGRLAAREPFEALEHYDHGDDRGRHRALSPHRSAKASSGGAGLAHGARRHGSSGRASRRRTSSRRRAGRLACSPHVASWIRTRIANRASERYQSWSRERHHPPKFSSRPTSAS